MLYRFLRYWKGRQLDYHIPKFAHHNRDLLIIVMDPDTDKIYACYRDMVIVDKFQTPTGQPTKFVKKMLKQSQFFHQIDKVQNRLSVMLGVSQWTHLDFFRFIADAVQSIGRSIAKYKNRRIK